MSYLSCPDICREAHIAGMACGFADTGCFDLGCVIHEGSTVDGIGLITPVPQNKLGTVALPSLGF
ncbi:MAG: hypothetical protein HC827_14370 [Cyanobacteria bacterium RM1_2_2]|nr:hypothetical protein [Cyanobacteria bacterium RM1_2_2]